MALKDWKKISEIMWRKKEENRNIIVVGDKKIKYLVEVEKDYHAIITKKFKTKKEALSYAMSYMRKH